LVQAGRQCGVFAAVGRLGSTFSELCGAVRMENASVERASVPPRESDKRAPPQGRVGR
jgi:hypothetical protein